jgi:autotransporter-associated beta strand protein
MPRAEAQWTLSLAVKRSRGAGKPRRPKISKFRQIFFMGASGFGGDLRPLNCGGLSIEAGCNQSHPPALMKNRKINPSLRLLGGHALSRNMATLLCAGALGAVGQSAFAATETWNAGADAAWDTVSSNWTPTATFTSGDDAVFDSTSSRNVTSATGLTIGTISLNSGYTGTVTMSGANTVNGATTISAGTLKLTNVSGLGTSAITVNSGGTLWLNAGNVTYSANNTISGSGTTRVTTGNGDVIISSVMSGFTGTLDLNQSVGNASKVRFTTTQANLISSSATINVNAGTTLYLNQALNYGASVKLFGAGNTEGLGALRLETGANQTGSVTLMADSFIGVNASAATISGAIGQSGGSFGFTKQGNNTLTLSGTNTYTGATAINGGAVTIAGNSTGLTGAFTVNANGNTASTLTLNGNTGSLASNATINLNGGIFSYQNTTVGSTFDASGYTFGGSDRTYQSTYGTSGNAVLNLANATRAAGTTNNYVTSGGANGTTNKITFTSAPTTGVLVDKGDYFGGTSYLTYDSTGYARAYNYSTDANGVTSTGGTTLGSVTGKNVDLTTAAVTAQTTDSINTLRLGTANGVTMAASNTLSVDGILKSGGNSAAIATGNIQTVSSGGEMVIRTNASGDTLTISSNIIDNGSSSLTKTGLGTLTLNGTNTYAGGTSLSSGTVLFNNASAFGTGAIASTGGVTIRNTATLTTTNNLTVNGPTTLDVNTGNWTFNGNISGSGAITRGTNANLSLTLGGNNSGYTGTFTSPNNGNAVVRFNSVNAGSANAQWVFNNATAGRTSIDFASGTISFGSLSGIGQIQGTNAGTKTISAGALNLNDNFAGIIADGTGTIALTKTGSGTMTLSGANTYTGATTLNGGTLRVNGSLSTSSAVGFSSTGATLAGAGTVGAITLTTGNFIAPGDGVTAIGTLTATSLTLSGGHFTFDLSASNNSSDKIALSGALADSGTSYTFDFSGGLANQTYTLITFGSTTFTDATKFTSTGVAGTFNLTGNSLTFTAVPEPHEFALAIVGLLGVLVFIRRRNQQV